MKKTLIITLEYPPEIGGIATYLSEFAKKLDRKKLLIYAPKHEDGDSYDLKNKLRVIRKKPLFDYFKPGWLKMLFDVNKIMKQNKIEMIHIHHILPSGLVANIMKKRYGVKYLVFFHGTDLALVLLDEKKKERTRKICQDAEQVIVNSVFMQNKFLKTFPEMKNKTIVLHPCPGENFLHSPGADILVKTRAELNLTGKRVFLTVARMVPEKGLDLVIDLLPDLVEKYPNLVWLAIGDGPKMGEYWEKIIEKNLQDFVRFPGRIFPEKLKNYYYISDFFALLSRQNKETKAEEGFGLVFLEAGSTGLPCVAGQSGGVSEAVIDGETGFVVDTNEKEDVKKAIMKLLENKDLREKMGQNAKKRIKKDFVWEKEMEKLS